MHGPRFAGFAKVTRSLAVAGALVALVPAAAQADQDQVALAMGGTPMNVYVGPKGQMQGFLAGQLKGIFFSPSNIVGDAGFFLAFPSDAMVPPSVSGDVFGFDGAAGPSTLSEYTPQGQSPVTGSGTAEDPLRQVTRYDVEDYDDRKILAVTQQTTYVNGQGRFVTQWDVRNVSPAPINFKAFAAADFYFDGDDWGTGVFTQGPPRFIGGTNVDTGRSGGFEETAHAGSPGWSRYESLRFAFDSYYDDEDVQERLWPLIASAGSSSSPTLGDRVIGREVDNAAAVEWDDFARDRRLAPNETATFSVITRAAIPATLQLTPPNPTSPQGVPITFTAAMTDTDGAGIFAGRVLRYSITGANPVEGQVAIGPDGRAAIVDAGGNLGQDTVTAWVDLDNDGVRGEAEPVASVVGTFVDVTPPVCQVRPLTTKIGGRGRKARALNVDVTCDSPATLTGSARLTVRVGTKRVRVKKGKRRVYRTVVVKRTVALPPAQQTAVPGQPARLALKVPAKYAKRYAKKPGSVVVTVRAADQAGNAAVATGKRNVKLVKYKR